MQWAVNLPQEEEKDASVLIGVRVNRDFKNKPSHVHDTRWGLACAIENYVIKKSGNKLTVLSIGMKTRTGLRCV
jgi:hypothetical protein